MRVLLFGRTGQLSSELKRARLPEALSLHVSANDVTDAASVAEALDNAQPNVVINSTAYTAVDRAETEPEQAFAVNARAPGILAAACARSGAALIHVSTDYVFDGSKPGAYSEMDPIAPIGAYGASKAEGERRVAAVLERHLILRTSWVFSAHGQNFVKTVLRLAREREELRVVADQHGRPTAACDLAVALLAIAERMSAGFTNWGTFHFAGDGITTWHGFAEAIIDEQARLTRRRPTVTPITSAEYPTPAKRPANSVLDTTRFEQVFGVRPRAWRDGLREVVQELVGP